MTTKDKVISIRVTTEQLARIQAGMKAEQEYLDKLMDRTSPSEFPVTLSEFVLCAALMAADRWTKERR